MYTFKYKTKLNSMALVRERTIPTIKYNPLKFQQLSILLDHSQGVVPQTSIHITHDLSNRLKVLS
jgi:hypothetical protein